MPKLHPDISHIQGPKVKVTISNSSAPKSDGPTLGEALRIHFQHLGLWIRNSRIAQTFRTAIRASNTLSFLDFLQISAKQQKKFLRYPGRFVYIGGILFSGFSGVLVQLARTVMKLLTTKYYK
jgi:hypothetical protein